MMRTISIGKFRRKPLHKVEACAGSSLAVTRKGKVMFYCVPADLFAKWAEATRMVVLEGRASNRRNSTEQPQDATIENDGLLRDPSMKVPSKTVLFHPHAYEEWRLLQAVAQRQVSKTLEAGLETQLFQPAVCLSLSIHSVRLVCESRPEALVVWAIGDRFLSKG